MGFSPSIDGLPTYPDPSVGVVLAAAPVSHVRLAAAVFDGTPGDGEWIRWTGRFRIVQAGGDWTLRGGRPGAIDVGRFDHWQERAGDGASGTYVAAEQTLWQGDRRGAAAFVQAGRSDAPGAERRHAGGGVALRGLATRRPQDVTGLGATWARLAPTTEAATTELVVEAFHRIALTPSISLIPDVQYLRRPAGDACGRPPWSGRCASDSTCDPDMFPE